MKRSKSKIFASLQDLLESRKISPVIDECYSLGKTAEAFRYFEKGHAQGKVLVTITAQKQSNNGSQHYSLSNPGYRHTHLSLWFILFLPKIASF